MASMIEYRQKMAERDLAQAWPQWRIVRLLGMGSFGEVYEIHREEYGRISKCALKIIRKEKTSGLPGDLYANLYRSNPSDEFINTVIKEIDIMETLKGASNIVVIDDYTVVRNEESDAVLIRMELLTNLGEFMTTRQVTMNDILRMGMDICTALDYCERQKIIHRDVKESNIFFSDKGDFKLGDFGISRQLSNYLTNNGTMTAAGTISKMAPEVYSGQKYDNRVDIYSLGMVLYTLLNYGRPPFYPPYPTPVTAEQAYEADAYRLRGMPVPPLSGVDPRLSDIICKACSVKPAGRYRTAQEFRAALEGYYEEINHLGGTRTTESRSGRKIIMLTAVIALVAVIAGSVTFWRLGTGRDRGQSESEAYLAENDVGNIQENTRGSVFETTEGVKEDFKEGESRTAGIEEKAAVNRELGGYSEPEEGDGTAGDEGSGGSDETGQNDETGESGQVSPADQDALSIRNMQEDEREEGSSGEDTPQESTSEEGTSEEGTSEEPSADGIYHIKNDSGKTVLQVRRPDWCNYEYYMEPNAVTFSGQDLDMWVQYFDNSSDISYHVQSDWNHYNEADPDEYEVRSLSEVTRETIDGKDVCWLRVQYRYNSGGEWGYYYTKFYSYIACGSSSFLFELTKSSKEGYLELSYDEFTKNVSLCTVVE